MIGWFAAFVVLLFFSQAYHYFYDNGLTSIAPVHWYITVLALFAVIVLLRARLLDHIAQATVPLVWVGFACFISIVSFIMFGHQHADSLDAIIGRIELLLLLAMFIVLFHNREAFKRGQQAAIVAVLLAVVLNFIDFSTPGGLFSIVLGRASGLYGNPNISGHFLVFGMVLTAQRVWPRWRLAYCLLIGAGVLVTFSRSAMLMWALAMFAVAYFDWFRMGRTLSIAVVSGGVGLVLVALNAGVLVQAFDTLSMGQMLNENARLRIGGSFIEQHDFSKQDRIYVAIRALEQWKEAPLFGHGIGSNALLTLRSHNQYLEMASELGVFGPALLIALMWLLWRTGTSVARVLLLVYIVSCFFSHNNLDYPGVQIALAMALSSGAMLPAETARG